MNAVKRIITAVQAMLLAMALGILLQAGPARSQGSQTQAVAPENIQERGGVCYRTGDSAPYTGLVRDHHESGKPRLEARYEAGRLESSRVWYENGRLAEEVNVSGDTWVVRRYSDEGRLEEETRAQVRGGRKVSERSTVWYENGNIHIEAGFANGKLHGPLKEYTPEGGLVRDETYDNGVMVKKAK